MAGAGLIKIGTGEIVGVGATTTGAAEIVGGELITGEGEAAGTDDVGIVRVQADREIVPIPISNLKYFTLNCK